MTDNPIYVSISFGNKFFNPSYMVVLLDSLLNWLRFVFELDNFFHLLRFVSISSELILSHLLIPVFLFLPNKNIVKELYLDIVN